jgi:hypothetical protein
MVGMQFRSLTYGDWVQRSKDCRKLGQLFHEKIDAVRGEASHAPDKLHDHWVGATIACAIAGNLGKGIAYYNRWARQIGYADATIINVNPPLVDVGDAIVQISNGALDVLEIKPRSGSAPTQ